MSWINAEAHKVVIDSLYYGETKTEINISDRLLEIYLDAHYEALSPEFFYTLYTALLDTEGYGDTLEWILG